MRKLLVVGPSWVGDTVLAEPLLMLLRERHPGVDIHFLAPPWTAPLVERMPEASKVIVNPFGHGVLALAERRRFGHRLRPEQYDGCLVLPNSLKSALIPWFAGIPLRTGYRGELRFGLINDLRQLDTTALPQMVQRFAALGIASGETLPAALPPPRLASSPAQQSAVANRLALETLVAPVVICPGAEYGPAKRWPTAHFALLGRQLLDAGQQVWILGSPKDAAIAEAINAGTGGHCINLCGKTSLAEAVDLLALSRGVITNDSGLMHVAAAVGRPLIALYGSSSPAFTPPISRQSRILSLNLDCSPCFQRVCPLGHFRCMNELMPAQVFSVINETGMLN